MQPAAREPLCQLDVMRGGWKLAIGATHLALVHPGIRRGCTTLPKVCLDLNWCSALPALGFIQPTQMRLNTLVTFKTTGKLCQDRA